MHAEFNYESHERMTIIQRIMMVAIFSGALAATFQVVTSVGGR